MRNLFTTPSSTIEAGQAVSGIAERNRTLRIVEGRVWITVEGIGHDYWLAAGDSFAAVPGRLIVVEAVDGASRVAQSAPVAGRLRKHLISFLTNRSVHTTGASRIKAAPAGQRPCGECL